MFRFMMIQDTLGTKVLPLIAELRLGESKAAMWLDILSQLERLHVITTEDDWQQLREIRNMIIHDYDEEPTIRVNLISKLYDKTKLLLKQIELIDSTINQLNHIKT